MNTTQKTIISVLTLAVLAVIIFLVVRYGGTSQEVALVPETSSSQDLCFYSSQDTPRGFSDVAWIRMKQSGSSISGEFKNLPAETDSKVGMFSGIITGSSMGETTADAWWDTRAEGMSAREQLILKYTDTAIRAGFAEMVDRGDGTYVYKDPNNIPYYKSIPAVSCSWMNAKLSVEEYVRAHINDLAPERPTLGGTWYVVRVSVDPDTNTGSVTYEDGHSQTKGPFRYILNSNGAVESIKLGSQ
jgi:hypothetical protein